MFSYAYSAMHSRHPHHPLLRCHAVMSSPLLRLSANLSKIPVLPPPPEKLLLRGPQMPSSSGPTNPFAPPAGMTPLHSRAPRQDESAASGRHTPGAGRRPPGYTPAGHGHPAGKCLPGVFGALVDASGGGGHGWTQRRTRAGGGLRPGLQRGPEPRSAGRSPGPRGSHVHGQGLGAVHGPARAGRVARLRAAGRHRAGEVTGPAGQERYTPALAGDRVPSSRRPTRVRGHAGAEPGHERGQVHAVASWGPSPRSSGR